MMGMHTIKAWAVAASVALSVGGVPSLCLAADAADPAQLTTGQQVYAHICQACHMADGRGGVGAGTIPALASNPHLAVAAYPATVVMNGKGAMPWFNGVLSPAQIADVVNYVRAHFGNHYTDALTPQTVGSMAGPLKVDDH